MAWATIAATRTALGQACGIDEFLRTIRMALARETARLESGLTWLATVGSVAPFVWPVWHGVGYLSRAGGHWCAAGQITLAAVSARLARRWWPPPPAWQRFHGRGGLQAPSPASTGWTARNGQLCHDFHAQLIAAGRPTWRSGSFDKGAGAPMAEISTTPLVDVMLVLLVVFIITRAAAHPRGEGGSAQGGGQRTKKTRSHPPGDQRPGRAVLERSAGGATTVCRRALPPPPRLIRWSSCICAPTARRATTLWPAPWPPPGQWCG